VRLPGTRGRFHRDACGSAVVAAQLQAMGEYEFRHLYLPRGTSRGAATRLLTDHAEYGHWELQRLRLFADGSRRVVLRRRVIRAVRTA
jgi:Family of unknown function (DUF5703)